MADMQAQLEQMLQLPDRPNPPCAPRHRPLLPGYPASLAPAQALCCSANRAPAVRQARFAPPGPLAAGRPETAPGLLDARHPGLMVAWEPPGW
jgi:hypothetical protein